MCDWRATEHHRQCVLLPRRLKLDTRPIRRDKARGRLVSATKLQLGNLLGSGNRFEGLHEITAAVAVDIRGRVILFEFEADCQLFRAQVGHDGLILYPAPINSLQPAFQGMSSAVQGSHNVPA